MRGPALALLLALSAAGGAAPLETSGVAVGSPDGASAGSPAGKPLRYGGYLAGAQIGKAEINVQILDDVYVISGAAWTLGIVHAATHWRSDFSATGLIRDGVAVPESYRFNTNRRGDRSRTTRIRNGIVETFRNGEARDENPVPAGLDVLTALFFPGDCKDLDELHTGTTRYTLQLRNHHVPDSASAGYAEKCAFDVVDDEGDSYRIDISMAEYNGHRVPLRVDVIGFFTGSARLLEAPDDLFEGYDPLSRTHDGPDTMESYSFAAP